MYKQDLLGSYSEEWCQYLLEKKNHHGKLMVMQGKGKHRMTLFCYESYCIQKSKKEKQTHMAKNGYKGILQTKSIN